MESLSDVLAEQIAQRVVALMKKGSGELNRTRDVTPALMNIDEAGAYLGRSPKSVRDLIRKQIIRPVRIDRKIQIKRKDLDAVIERYTE